MNILKPLQLLRQPLRVSLRSISNKPAVNPKFRPLADDELTSVVLELVWRATACNQRKKGVHEAKKTLYWRTSEFIVMAADTDPTTILDPLISLAREKKVPYVFVPSKIELGGACKVNAAVAACSILTCEKSYIEGDVLTVKEAIINLSN
ncbi:hypothetical protein SUGI_0838400 [Cryptomeria japonica]|uniref:13 kDa ribonucleoprotein-associated protein n=1 Tax=Cryptomeria japonica TaxID=3369 RepID=UPI002414CDEE|nr:13 kDa ribonucleoprotein-associated protein [Cryptomeria japonica]GLJ40615.1 hypothetical protein SUGI_0838400 [Cryptomeria japonica]